MLAELLDVFRWDSPDQAATLAALERQQLVTVAGGLNERLAAPIRARLEALPDAAYLAILRGPDTFHAAVHRSEAELGAAVDRWIELASAVVGAPASFTSPARTACCTRIVHAARGRITSIEDLPRVAGLAVDFTSELPDRLLTRYERTLVPPAIWERAATLAKLEAAFDVLRATSPRAHAFVIRMTGVICCRTATGDPRFYTASDATTLGAVHLINTHLPRKTAAQVASELVHEAIHQAVFRFELSAPLLLDRELALAQVRSPWTGAELDLHAFAHACFVWFGVANLWRLATAPASDDVARQRQQSEAGFVLDPLAHIGALRERLPAPLAAAIDRMRVLIVDSIVQLAG